MQISATSMDTDMEMSGGRKPRHGAAFPNEVFTGKIIQVHTLQRFTEHRHVQGHPAIDNPDQFRPGMTANVTFYRQAPTPCRLEQVF
jgi:hypothetical protein